MITGKNRNRTSRLSLLALSLGLFAFNASGGAAEPLTLIAPEGNGCAVVFNPSNSVEVFAFGELQEIVRKSTGVELTAQDSAAPMASTHAPRILIGRNDPVANALGRELLDSLKAQESLVTRRGDDLVLTGGDDWGVIYAVYDFVENEMGYRCFAPYPGGERFVQTNALVYSGVETRRVPAFPGYRITYTSPLMFRERIQDFARFVFRNRGTQIDWERYGKGSSHANDIGLPDPYVQHVHGHALFYFVSPHDTTWTFWREGGLKGSFEEHPEYFTWDQHGKRVDDIQLCFSSPELRRLMTDRVLEAVKAKGDGVYMVGSNDHSNQRYCWCPGCRAMEEKYNSVGGPLWDYLLELCALLEKDHPGVFIKSLAYKGPAQTEKAPEGVRFPDNFICDAAFLNSCVTLKEIPPATLEDGTVFDKFDNLKRWASITDHVAYWYYGGGAPFQVYERPAKEIRELRDAGVKSVGACGLGSMEFGDLTTYLYFRLLADPDLDEGDLVGEFLEFKYGAAAPAMRAFIDELEQIRRDNIGDRTKAMYADDTYEMMGFVEAEQLVRWQTSFDRMLENVREDETRLRNVRIARTAVDCWTTVFLYKVRAAFPEMSWDAGEVMARGRKSAEEAIAAGMLTPKHPAAFKVLNDFSLYANLRDDALPDELSVQDDDLAYRFLPTQPAPWAAARAGLTEDPGAVAGWTMKETLQKPASFAAGVPFEYYDALQKTWVTRGAVPIEAIKPGQYQLHKLFTATLPQRNRLVFGHLWGTSLDVMKLGRYYDPSYQQRQFEVWASLKCEGPTFGSADADLDNAVSCDQLFLIARDARK